MSIYCKIVRALAVVLMATPHIASQAPPELSSTLYSTISGAPVGFSNENVTFTCIIRGSNQMEWTSDQYIGTGGRSLDFISTNMPGRIEIQGEAVAILIRAARNEVIESQLFIRIQSSITNASVQCQDVGTGMTASIEFRLADNDISVDCDRQSVCPGEAVTCVCATGSSNRLAWVIDQNRLEFVSSDPLQTRRDINAFGILTNRSNTNRIEVITSNLTVTASKDDTSLQIQCENVDSSTSNPVTIPVLQNCPAITTLPVTKPDPSTSSNPAGFSVAVAILVVICFVLAVVIVILIIAAWRKLSALQKACDKKDDEIKFQKGKVGSLETTMEEMNQQIILKDDEILRLGSTNSGLNQQIILKNDEIQRLRSANLGLVAEKDGEIVGLKAKNARLSEKITGKDAKISELQGKVAKKDHQIRDLNEKITERDKKMVHTV